MFVLDGLIIKLIFISFPIPFKNIQFLPQIIIIKLSAVILVPANVSHLGVSHIGVRLSVVLLVFQK